MRFDRFKGKGLHKYPRLEFGTASKSLRDNLNFLLKDLGFSSFKWDQKSCFPLCLAGSVKLERWIKEIRPKNSKHLKKYRDWKKNGFYTPKIVGMAQSGTALDKTN